MHAAAASGGQRGPRIGLGRLHACMRWGAAPGVPTPRRHPVCCAAGEITKLAVERKLLRCTGKTPENTMASALYTEVRKKAGTTVFIM